MVRRRSKPWIVWVKPRAVDHGHFCIPHPYRKPWHVTKTITTAAWFWILFFPSFKIPRDTQFVVTISCTVSVPERKSNHLYVSIVYHANVAHAHDPFFVLANSFVTCLGKPSFSSALSLALCTFLGLHCHAIWFSIESFDLKIDLTRRLSLSLITRLYHREYLLIGIFSKLHLTSKCLWLLIHQRLRRPLL